MHPKQEGSCWTCTVYNLSAFLHWSSQAFPHNRKRITIMSNQQSEIIFRTKILQDRTWLYFGQVSCKLVQKSNKFFWPNLQVFSTSRLVHCNSKKKWQYIGNQISGKSQSICIIFALMYAWKNEWKKCWSQVNEVITLPCGNEISQFILV